MGPNRLWFKIRFRLGTICTKGGYRCQLDADFNSRRKLLITITPQILYSQEIKSDFNSKILNLSLIWVLPVSGHKFYHLSYNRHRLKSKRNVIFARICKSRAGQLFKEFIKLDVVLKIIYNK